MVNQAAKFTPNLAELSQPLHELLSTKTVLLLGPCQDAPFVAIKQKLERQNVLPTHLLMV